MEVRAILVFPDYTSIFVFIYPFQDVCKFSSKVHGVFKVLTRNTSHTANVPETLFVKLQQGAFIPRSVGLSVFLSVCLSVGLSVCPPKITKKL